jgi:hypothetical protein
MLWGLAGCGGWGGPPKADIVAAVTQQAMATQQQLWDELGGDATALNFTVDQVKTQSLRRLPGTPLTYEVAGTYRFSIRYPSRRRSQSRVPFVTHLRAGDEAGWQWLPSPDAV